MKRQFVIAIGLTIIVLELVNTTFGQQAMPPTIAQLNDINPLNCTPHIPNKVLEIMRNYSRASGAEDMLIPPKYLQHCLLDAPYDNRVSTLYMLDRPVVEFSFALNQVLSLDFSGQLVLSASINLVWYEPRLTWNLTSDVEHWTWHDMIDVMAGFIWMPTFTVLNCPLADCRLALDNSSEVDIQNDGLVVYNTSQQLTTSCHIDLSLFPFDEQRCAILFDLDNSIPFSYSVQVANEAATLYYDESDEWLVTSLQCTNDLTNQSVFVMSAPNNWTVSTLPTDNKSTVVRLSLVRTSSSDVYILIAPLFVIICLGMFAVVYPSNEPEKPLLLLHILLAFTVFMLLIGDNHPTSSSAPYIGLYITSSMILAALHLLAACVVLRVHQLDIPGHSRPPYVLRVLLIRPVLELLDIYRRLKAKLSRAHSVDLRKALGTPLLFTIFNINFIKVFLH